jgi:hypothetical protein
LDQVELARPSSFRSVHLVGARLFALLLCGAIILPGCHHSPEVAPPRTWHTAVTPDSALTFRVPPGYRQRNAYGCWARFDGVVPSPADFCLSLAQPEHAGALGRAWDLMCGSPESRVGHTPCYEKQRVDTATFDGRPAVIRRALVSGTIGHYRRVPAVLVLIPLGPAGVAVLQGEHREPGTASELIAIASTVRPFLRVRD